MNLLCDVRLEQWQIDKILPKFYQLIKEETFPDLGDEGRQSMSIPSIIICYILEHSIISYIADFATECAREL